MSPCQPSPLVDQKDTASAADDHDSPWKIVVEVYFELVLRLLAPKLHAAIDWSVPPAFLDKELQSIGLPSKRGRLNVDKLVGVQLLSGEAVGLLIHIEVQGRVHGPKAAADIAHRMCRYYWRIQEKMMLRREANAQPKIYSLAILTDSTGTATHLTYATEVFGSTLRFSCPVIYLGNWAARVDELEQLAPGNPFAVFILAQLEANRHPDKRTRLAPKVALVRRLGQYGYGPDEIRLIFRLVDWVIKLPKDLEPVFEQTLQALSQEKEMTYVSTIERWGIKKGLQEGRQEGLQEGLIKGQANMLLGMMQRRFGPVTSEITQRVHAASSEQLESWALNFVDATTLDDVFRD